MRTFVNATFQKSHRPVRQVQAEDVTPRGPSDGLARTWHPSGIRASEQRYKDGLLHGVCRQWDESGNLLGEFKMDHGTGVQREWHDNGQIKIEVSTVRGEFCGRNRIWLRDGTLISERFYLYGKQVKLAEYEKAAGTDKSLPRYTDAPVKLPGDTVAKQRHIHEAFVAGLLESVNQREAHLWLEQHGIRRRKHLLGRFPSQSAASTFVKSLYEAGAEEVIVPTIYLDEHKNEFADALIVRLPKAEVARVKIRKTCAILRRRSLGSFQPDSDIGEKYLYLGFA